ncbi:MAG: nucleotidyltransferase domain-containing protein [Leptolyngbyaceae cyanobacterium MO_188.B28]|nr:nucleotidyltransferase domain-containing protein [Leptolyngbyaceae cyanobacterium MO_188.B28]
MQPLNTKRINLILEEVTQWASQRNDIAAVALVGSWARGAARVDSDIDSMLLVTNPVSFRQDEKWIDEIHWSAVNAEVDNWKDKDYGVIWSRHVYLDDATEIEFGVGPRSWASVNPIDLGTFRVVNDGCQILYDPENLLSVLIYRVKSAQAS